MRTGGRGRVRAPILTGTWVNADPPVPAGALVGVWTLVDFWTAGCVNCVHVLDELAELERRWAPRLRVLGVHSPKFPHEAAEDSVRTAIGRLGVAHPVLNDPGRALWSAYNVKAWPTLVLVDPDGYIAGTFAGERHTDDIEARLFAAGVPATGRDREPGARTASGLRYPWAALTTPARTVLVSDAGNHRIVEYTPDLGTELRQWGDGRGRPLSTPAGMTLLPDGLLPGVDVVVADAAAHVLHGLSLRDGSTRVLAGTGAQWYPGDATDGRALHTRLSTPTDVAWWPEAGVVVVAGSGNHTLLALDPVAGTVRRLAGTGVEGLADGPAERAFLAQPSGVAADGDTLWFVDAESSSLRSLRGGAVRTHVGAGLFDYGHVDGPAPGARLQHPTGLAVAAGGSILLADTYNGALRRVEVHSGAVSTLATGLAEPYGVLVDEGRTVVVCSASHRLHVLDGASRSDGGVCTL